MESDRSRLLLQETTAATGMGYLRALVLNTAKALDAQWAFIGRLMEDGEHVEVMVVWDHDDYGEPFVYPLRGTPCENVMAGDLCHYPDLVQELFPEDPMLADMGAQAYSGVAVGHGGRTLGLLAALYDRPVGPIGEIEPVLWVAASRAALEIERMESEAALRVSETRYRSLIEQCSEGVWSIDASGITDFVNPQMAAMLGLRSEDMLGRPMYDFMDASARAEAEKNLERRQHGITERHSFRLKHANGSDVWTEMAASPIVDDSGQPVGALAFVTDLTDHRRLQESMQQKQKLESLGMMAGGVAHDFNNLLAGILGNADVGLMQPDLSPVLERVLHRIQSSALQAAELTKQLLTYAGHTPFRAEPLRVSDLVEEVAGMLEAAVPTGVELTMDLPRSIPLIEGDRTQLTQVLLNLVTNATDAIGGRGGEVRLSTGVLAAEDELLQRGYVADQLEPVDHVFVRVTDDGAGMDETTRAHIFDPFFSTKESGHGLGLAAVLGILRRHRGTVVIDSALGEGSTFTVCLPARDDVQEAVTDRRPSRPAAEKLLQGRRILLVDDEKLLRSVLVQLLRASGAEVDEAANGAEALAAVAERPGYDAIVLDMAMPRMDGAETLRRLREGGCESPVLLCSGHASYSLPEDPSTAWLPKPFRKEELMQTLRQLIDGAQGSVAEP